MMRFSRLFSNIPKRLPEAQRKTYLDKLSVKGWSLNSDRDAISKKFLFKDFNDAFEFMKMVAIQSENMNHHPEVFYYFNFSGSMYIIR